MSNRIALDTTFIVGLVDDHDVWRARTLDLQAALEARDFKPVILDCVMAEAISTIARRVHERRRTADLTQLLARIREQFPTGLLVWLYPDLPKWYDAIVALVEQSAGELNFNDALIALSCRSRQIEYLASFDSDFDRHATWLKRIAYVDQL